MATQKKPKGKNSHDPSKQEANFSVEPGTKVRIIVEMGEKIIKGKVPLTVRLEQIPEEEYNAQTTSLSNNVVDISVVQANSLRVTFDALKSHLKAYGLAMWLFIFAIIIYLATRLVGLTQFPIYFFTDEAIQTQSIIDLIKNGYLDPVGRWFPTYFRNGDYYNLSLSVYLQWLPYLIFGKSAFVTRAASVFVTLIAATSIGVMLRDVFKLKYWWTGTLFLSITPAWFLHSRTAFETAEFVAFYSGALCAYLLYRYQASHFLYLAIFLSALAFYSYGPAQLIVPLTAIGLFFSDWRYHWENRRTAGKAFILLLILALPYIRSSIGNPDAPLAHLHTLWSYWFENIPLSEKIARYVSEFGLGLSPWYWYIPNERDLPRHLMKDYGHIMMLTLPFALFGMAHVLRNLSLSVCRAILIVLLISPAAAALVQIGITRVLAFVVPMAILTSIGLEQYLHWLEDSRPRLLELAERPPPNSGRLVQVLFILLIGLPFAFLSKEIIDRVVIAGLTIILALKVSGAVERFAQFITRGEVPKDRRLWKPSQRSIALSVFVILAGLNLAMLSDALRNSPLWFRDYGLNGMQYGAFQIFDVIEEYHKENPNTKIIFSPDWANGTDVVARFFLEDPASIQFGSIHGPIIQKLPLDDNTLFIITPQEYDIARKSDKLTHIKVERIIPYPDDTPGFYFIRLRYVDNIDEIFAAEKAVRQVLQESIVTMDGQTVKLRHTYLDADFQDKAIALLFDDDPYTLAKTFENNPFVIEMIFPEPRVLNGFSIILGAEKLQITLKCYIEPGAQPVIYTFEGQGTPKQTELTYNLPALVRIQALQVEIFDPLAPDPAKIHVWELRLR